MGAACSAPLSTPPGGEKCNSSTSELSTNEVIATLRDIFPEWDDTSLKKTTARCEGHEAELISHLVSWGKHDKRITPIISCEKTNILPRNAYDIFMRTHLLRHSSLASNIISMQAAAKFVAQARMAKKAVAQRHLEKGFDSDVALCFDTDRSELVSTPAQDNNIQNGMRLMSERLNFLNLRMVEMEDDGNCQFRAISYELYGTQSHHLAVRKKIVAHLKSNSDTFSFYVGEDKEWRNYIKKMSKDSTWGDELTITAASQAFRVRIHIVSTEKSNWLLHYDGSNIDGETDLNRDLFLIYVSPIHYNVVAPPITTKRP